MGHTRRHGAASIQDSPVVQRRRSLVSRYRRRSFHRSLKSMATCIGRKVRGSVELPCHNCDIAARLLPTNKTAPVSMIRFPLGCLVALSLDLIIEREEMA